MNTLNGLPAHVLLVHAVVVLLPLAALLLVLTAVWPAARHKLAGANAILSAVVVVLVPITTEAGEWLERRVDPTPQVHTHAELGDTAVFVALPIAVLAIALWWRHREDLRARSADADASPRRAFLAPASTAATTVIAVLAVVAAGAAVYDVYRIGDSGAQASWQGKFSTAPVPRGQGR